MSHWDAKIKSDGCEGRESRVEGSKIKGRRLTATDSDGGFNDDQQVLKETDIQDCRKRVQN
jgi:hypothetical protein